MVSTQYFLWVALVTWFVGTSAHGEASTRPAFYIEVGAGRVTASLPEREQNSSREQLSPHNGGRRPVAAAMTVGCRKRIVCEAARSLTDMLPISGFWKEIVKGRPHPKNAYFAAWSRGLQKNECAHMYPDCSDSAAGMVLPLVSEAVGPKGIVSSFIERLNTPAASHVPREPGAPRPSLVMEKLREYRRRIDSDKPRTPPN
ncbi:uncharacterized protein LOC119381171 [Rhipicephalus sanguineus]|uniref:uncharacterized protein LOC119381171 n=1 Tax=Rhipicephalus sanguineus TaxID=34632 RepID=UPI00189399D9|nr:uncharacterized protein LOC119381171 [Rhipicephalus sanguineus]